MFSRLATLTTLATMALGASIPLRRATVCNGHAELCGRSYGNITFVGAHDSAFFSADPLALARDQEIDIPSQLALGVRMLQAQSHVNNGVLHFCHTSCSLFDGGPVVDYLKTVKTFMDANPNEVLTFIFTNPEGQSPANVWKPLFDEAGLSDLAFVPPTPGTPIKQSEWPTLGQMIDSGKRLVVFMDAGADGSDSVDFIMPEFQMVWEAPFSSTDPTFPCRVDRIAGPLADVDHMFMINHNLNTKVFGSNDVLVSDPADAPTTNSPTSILADANGCSALPASGARAPNFLLVDYVNLGDPFTAAATLNNLPLPAPAAAAPAPSAGDEVKQAASDAGGKIVSGVESIGNAIKGLFGRAYH